MKPNPSPVEAGAAEELAIFNFRINVQNAITVERTKLNPSLVVKAVAESIIAGKPNPSLVGDALKASREELESLEAQKEKEEYHYGIVRDEHEALSRVYSEIREKKSG